MVSVAPPADHRSARVESKVSSDILPSWDSNQQRNMAPALGTGATLGSAESFTLQYGPRFFHQASRLFWSAQLLKAPLNEDPALEERGRPT